MTTLSQGHSHTCEPLCCVRLLDVDILGMGMGTFAGDYSAPEGTALPGLGLLEARGVGGWGGVFNKQPVLGCRWTGPLGMSRAWKARQRPLNFISRAGVPNLLAL